MTRKQCQIIINFPVESNFCERRRALFLDLNFYPLWGQKIFYNTSRNFSLNSSAELPLRIMHRRVRNRSLKEWILWQNKFPMAGFFFKLLDLVFCNCNIFLSKWKIEKRLLFSVMSTYKLMPNSCWHQATVEWNA